MNSKLRYDPYVKRLNSATGAALALMLAALISFTANARAQINGTPASVTSINFGGHPNPTPGVPASITSLGPNGFQPKNPFNQPACCANPLNPNSHLIPRHPHRRGQFFPAGGAVYVPYAYPVAGDSDAGDTAADQPDEYLGGPTIFDRRGPGQPAPYADAYAQRPPRAQAQTEAAPATSAPDPPVPDQPQTVLIFKDGHQLEVQNYAVIGDTLFDLTPGRHRKIPIADVDLSATVKENDVRGVDFRLPPQPEMSK